MASERKFSIFQIAGFFASPFATMPDVEEKQ